MQKKKRENKENYLVVEFRGKKVQVNRPFGSPPHFPKYLIILFFVRSGKSFFLFWGPTVSRCAIQNADP
jgi:hypothetical protein